MSKRSHSRYPAIAGFLYCAWLITACDPGEPVATDMNSAEQQAARENVEAMAQEHAGDSNEPSPAAQIAPQRAVISERLPYAEVGEELVYGYFVFPSDMVEPLPAVIMIHEWWGLNENIHAMADRLAGEGYIVLAVDLFGGEVAATAQAARQLMLRVAENPKPAYDNIRAAYAFVSEVAGAPRIASLGWCFGGGWSLNTALIFPDDLDAAIIYYGQVTDDEEQLRPVNVPILGLFGALDTGITVASVQAFEAALQRLRKPHSIHIYPDANHAFANPTGRAYNANIASDAWQKTLEFLKQNLVETAVVPAD
ncbi:MAG: dienelactone hydrolase family protein [Gammaproteobacteria bacterium]|nr:dienelactone hydrolase family protein [Gammaproteobacteria bacterium]MDH5305043.1 dienelactone hydrolase family protein [Gammaproteobacteria bacterium]MDH5322845.1 dienelactone hydrolase family protein [Gammaproteobacteria bacterium]